MPLVGAGGRGSPATTAQSGLFKMKSRVATPFDAVTPFTIGLEEEAMLLHPVTLDLLPEVGRVLARVPEDDRFKPELPAAQVELVTPPCATVGEAIGLLAAGRHDLARAVEGIGRIAVAGVHPFAGRLVGGPQIFADFGAYASKGEFEHEIARRHTMYFRNALAPCGPVASFVEDAVRRQILLQDNSAHRPIVHQRGTIVHHRSHAHGKTSEECYAFGVRGKVLECLPTAAGDVRPKHPILQAVSRESQFRRHKQMHALSARRLNHFA